MTFRRVVAGLSTVGHSANHVLQNFIDGGWVPSVSAKFRKPQPCRYGDLIGCFKKSTAADAARAIDAARRAYEHWRLVPAAKRAELLFRVAQLLTDRKEAWPRLERENGEVLDETRRDVRKRST